MQTVRKAQPAPIDPERLAPALEPFGHSHALPSEAYTSPEVFEWELEHFFDASWLCLGRVGARHRHPSSVEWRGWEFVNPSGDGVGFERHVGHLDDYFAPYEPERLMVGVRHSYELAANWKLIAENYQKYYHYSEIHPALCRVSPPESSVAFPHDGLYVAGPMLLRDDAETMSLDGRSHGIPLRGLDDELRRQVGYVGMWPSFLISRRPDLRRVRVAVPTGARGASRLRSLVGRGFLGRDQSGGLARGGVPPARRELSGLSPRRPVRVLGGRRVHGQRARGLGIPGGPGEPAGRPAERLATRPQGLSGPTDTR